MGALDVLMEAHKRGETVSIQGGSGGIGGDHSHRDIKNSRTINRVTLINAKAAFWLAWGAAAWQALGAAAQHLQ